MKTDYKTIDVNITDDIAILTMNNPPVNQLSTLFKNELFEAISEGFADSSVKALVLTGTGKNFIAGADLREIFKITDKDALLKRVGETSGFLNRIEAGPKPVIAAINGNSLGGGLETAMACHYRVASRGVRIGQPEVKVGLIPGAGGTQRLPRLIGLPKALEMMTVGDPITAEDGLSSGVIDEVVDHDSLVATAVAAARRFIQGSLDLESHRTRNRRDRLPSAEELTAAVQAAKSLTGVKAKSYMAPFKVIEAVESGLTEDMETDILREMRLFCDCAISDVAKNLIGIFLSARASGRHR